MAAYRALDHKVFFQSGNITASDSSPKSRPRTAPSPQTTSSLSSSTLWPSILSPSALQQTVHVITRPGDPSLSLRLCSRAPSVGSTPIFHAGDIIKGDVMLSVVPQEAPYITSVEIELRGVTYIVGSAKPHGFLSIRSTLWTDTPDPDTFQGNGMALAGKESTEQPRPAQPFYTSFERPRSSSNSPYHAFRSALQSMARLFELQLDEQDPPHTIKPSQLKRPRRQLEAPRPHVWPFELLLPASMSSGKRAPAVAVDSETSLTPQGHYSNDDPEGSGVHLMQPPENEGEKGGVREEKAGYGVGWSEGGEDKMNQVETGNVLRKPRSMRTLQSADGTNLSRPVEQSAVMSVDDRHTFMLPPSFSEPAGDAWLQYVIVVTVHRRGGLRENWSLQRKLHVPHYSFTGLPFRAIHPPITASQLLDPLDNPHGWNFVPEVVLGLQPKPSLSSKRNAENLISKDVVLKLALSRPLCYAGGTAIPFRVTVSIPHPYSSSSQGALKLSRRRKFNFSSALTSQTTLFSPSFALSLAPLFHRSRSTATSSFVRSQFTERVSSRRPTPVSQGSQDEPELPYVPSASSIASAIKLVRAIHVGPDANDDVGVRHKSESFLQTISTAVILDDDVAENDSDGETGVAFKAWTTEQGRLVRTFVGEIPLKNDVKPSFIFPHFVVKYAVVLFPFEACGFVPSSREPLWSEPVNITAHLTEQDLAKIPR